MHAERDVRQIDAVLRERLSGAGSTVRRGRASSRASAAGEEARVTSNASASAAAVPPVTLSKARVPPWPSEKRD
jgi:hypothetical protein